MRNSIAGTYFTYRYFREFSPDIVENLIYKYFYWVVAIAFVMTFVSQFYKVPDIAPVMLVVR